jgi:RNA polymerase sigma factor (sigma-70 family)
MIHGADFAARTAEIRERLRRTIRRRSGARLRLLESASDLVQSVFRAMWRKRAAVPSDARGFWAWAKLEAERKTAERGRRASGPILRALSAVDPADLDCALSPRSEDPCALVAARESAAHTRHALSRALAGLSEEDRSVIIECRLLGRSVEEVAAAAAERPNTVSVRLYRALARLAERLPTAG